MRTRIAIIGGGASGMMAAITAADQGAEVWIYELKDRLGKKILATGNGKCNFTNMFQDDSCYRGTNPSFSKSVREQFTVENTLEFFRKIGIEPKVKNGYVYPNSEQAASVADALSMELRAKHVKVVQEQVYSVKGQDGDFLVKSEHGQNEFDKVILCCGSPAGMKNPKEFAGYSLAESFGHQITDLIPALVQLRCKEKWFKTISGVRCEGIIRVLENGKEIAKEKGELLFAEYGLSGIPVFQVSRFAGEALNRGSKVTCKVDLLPGYTKEELEARLVQRFESLRGRTAEELLVGLHNHKVNYVLLKELGIDPVEDSKKSYGTSDFIRLASLYKELTCQVTELNPFANAQVCAGGVDTSEIDDRTLESKLIKGLYFAGEFVDVDGTCGGYNLQWAWSSGYVAGFHAAK
ncbi:MAG: NAD(P)/FAD-dependent oxidoreductase [Lachnospiraceae bacterium]|nr:NAD(P)/FAD-dependent oxidoreductase [Lachnospiraceae bacterium]